MIGGSFDAGINNLTLCLTQAGSVATLLQRKVEGPLIHVYTRTVLQWQLGHPEGTKDDCTNWILANPDKFPHPDEFPSPPKKKKPQPDNASDAHHEHTEQPGQVGALD